MIQHSVIPHVMDIHVRCHKCQHFIGYYRQPKPNTTCEWFATGAFQSIVGRTGTPMDARRKLLDAHEMLCHENNF